MPFWPDIDAGICRVGGAQCRAQIVIKGLLPAPSAFDGVLTRRPQPQPWTSIELSIHVRSEDARHAAREGKIGSPEPMIDRLTTALSNRYRIERELGAGGMATVYLADDLRHDRKVALKVLKPELAAVVGAERFVGEIRTTANLRHPHILPLFDSGEADGFLYYVMPYVQGESLRERLDREKQLPVGESVAIVIKVAGALQAAHDAGVIHRDIKPANILLEKGEPVVADFGIALAVQGAGGRRLTETGLSLGTPYYMSPEQATGDREPDARSDVYALGAVLYEMLTGEPPFTGSTAQAVLGRILTGEATSPTQIRKSIPPNVGAAVLTAVERLPADRFASAREFAHALGEPGYRAPAGRTAAATAPRTSWLRDPRTVGLVLASLVALLGVALVRPAADPPSADATPWRSTIPIEGVGTYTTLNLGRAVKLSADGSRLFVFNRYQGLAIRDAVSEGFTLEEGTQGMLRLAAVSPTGDRYLLEGDSGLVVGSVGGALRSARLDDSGRVFEWLPGDTLLIRANEGILAQALGGGASVQVAEPPTSLVEDGRSFHPQALDRDRDLVYYAFRGGGIWSARSSGEEPRELVPDGVDLRLLPNRAAVYVDLESRLWGLRLSEDGRSVALGPVPLVDGIRTIGGAEGYFSISDTGHLAFLAGGRTIVGMVPVLAGLDGTVEEIAVRPRPYPLEPLRWAPAGDALLLVGGRPDDLKLGAWRSRVQRLDMVIRDEPVLLGPGVQAFGGFWTRDGQPVVVVGDSVFGDDGAIVSAPVGDQGSPRVLDVGLDRTIVAVAGDRDLVFADASSTTFEYATYLRETFPVRSARIAPAADALVYEREASGGMEVVVRAFPESGPPITIATAGAFGPRWGPDGRTVFYWVRLDDRFQLRRAVVSLDDEAVRSDEGVLEQPEFPTAWALHPDGDRFVYLRPVGPEPAATPSNEVAMITDFFALVEEALQGAAGG